MIRPWLMCCPKRKRQRPKWPRSWSLQTRRERRSTWLEKSTGWVKHFSHRLLFVRPVDWLVCWLFNWFIDWLVDWWKSFFPFFLARGFSWKYHILPNLWDDDGQFHVSGVVEAVFGPIRPVNGQVSTPQTSESTAAVTLFNSMVPVLFNWLFSILFLELKSRPTSLQESVPSLKLSRLLLSVIRAVVSMKITSSSSRWCWPWRPTSTRAILHMTNSRSSSKVWFNQKFNFDFLIKDLNVMGFPIYPFFCHVLNIFPVFIKKLIKFNN